jgi:3-oxoacyl-[acyl-carrier-protein] synthase III
MQAHAGIRQTAVVLGERTQTVEELAVTVGARPDVAERWLGGLKVHVSSRFAAELGAEAARVCLARSNLTILDVPFIVFGSSSPPDPLEEGRRELHVQELLGAMHAVVMDVGAACSESITALRLAASLVLATSDAKRVLVVYGERRRERILGYDRETYQPVFSDVGAALVIERDAPLRLLGFGDATDGRYWDFLAEIRRRKPLPSAEQTPRGSGAPMSQMDSKRLRMLTDSVATNRLALERCLRAANIPASEIRHVLLTREGPRIPHAMLRQLGLATDLLYFPPGGPTHAGMADFVILLDQLMHEGNVNPETVLLLGSRAVGTTRFCLVRA